MKIKIIAPFKGAASSGLYGLPSTENPSGEIPIGTELEVDKEPTEWAGRYEVVSGGSTEGKTAVTNPAKDEPDREELKRQADELGLDYARNISTEKLKELIDEKLAQ